MEMSGQLHALDVVAKRKNLIIAPAGN